MGSIGMMTDKMVFSLLTTTGASTGSIIKIGEFSYGSVEIPSTSAITLLTFWVSSDGSTFVQPYDGATAITLTVAAGRAYRLPSDLFVHRNLRIQATGAAADVNITLGY